MWQNEKMPILQIDGLSFHYLVEGAGPPLLLLHGHGGSCRSWHHQVPDFSKSYRVICLDLRGFGESAKPPGSYSAELLAKDAAEVIRQVAGGPAHVLGHSMGGGIALQLALDAPELVRSLCIVNSQAHFVPEGFVVRFVMWASRWIPRLLGFKAHGKSVAAAYLPDSKFAAERERFIEHWTKNDLQGYLAAARGLDTFDIRSRLGEINAPTLVVGSEQDILPMEAKQDLVARLKNARLVVVKDSRHLVTLDQPEMLNRTVLEFLASVP
jgi:pimeloyl-ACP methyl ester carboxylesterase